MIIRGSLPDFSFEKDLWEKGFKFVGGVDEVGRGSFAGPVVAACVVFSPEIIYEVQGRSLHGDIVIDDSKRLTVKQRQEGNDWIIKNAFTYGIGQASVAKINKLGIKKATEIAFRKAVASVNQHLTTNNLELVSHLLVDAFFVPRLKNLRVGATEKYVYNNTSKVLFSTNQTAIVRGDQISLSIAAASIIAKVYRDNLMKNLSRKKDFKIYNWDKNKGYGTKDHRKAIIKFGQSKYHRRDFVKTFLATYSFSSQEQ